MECHILIKFLSNRRHVIIKEMSPVWQRMSLFAICLIFFVSMQCVLSYDEWNYVGCDELHQPKNCDFKKIYPITLDDFDRCGPANISIVGRNYYLAASGRRETYKDNREAFRRLKIIPKVLRDLSKNNMKTTVLDLEVDFPIGVSPVGDQNQAHPEGELATVTGLSSMKTIMILSSFANTPLEAVALKAKSLKAPLHLWMQTYIFTNRSITKRIVKRAERSGFKGIVVTVDSNVFATLTCNARTAIYFNNTGVSNVGTITADIVTTSATFKDITWLKKLTSLPIIVKGILTAWDAIQAIQAGASAIFVSNHGGRQLDGSPASIDALPKVADVVKELYPHIDIYMDGGVRSGGDVYKAIARGAKMVFVGRPTVWGLALSGSAGVKQMMTILKDEFKETMLLSGNTKPSEIERRSVVPGNAVFECPTPFL